MIRKHIKKKFIIELDFTEEEMRRFENSTNSSPFEEVSSLTKEHFGKPAFVTTDTNKVIMCFQYKSNGKTKLIPEPDPVLIFFHSAYTNYARIEETRKKILNILSEAKLTELIINELYDYFGIVTGFVIFSFTSLEAFINQSIPADITYKRTNKRSTEIFNKEQIERYFSFDDKLEVLEEVTQKNFSKKHIPTYQHIVNLKEFRDNIIHLKKVTKGSSPYDHIYKKAFDFKYSDSLNAVASFLNYYKPGYVEECPCEHNW